MSKWNLLTTGVLLSGVSLGLLFVLIGIAPAQDESEGLSRRFTFARIRYGGSLSNRALILQGLAPWAHDYPRGGRHLIKILTELTNVEGNPDEVILSFDDPELFNYPFAYICEVGFMQLGDAELKGMREYLLRGGFLLVDDFRGSWALQNLIRHLARAVPEYELKELDTSHPIFNCFFNIETLEVVPPYGGGLPKFYGLSDKNGRLMMIVNYNNDVSEYWEWSDDPFLPIEETNTAYKFGVNYAIYALTH